MEVPARAKQTTFINYFQFQKFLDSSAMSRNSTKKRIDIGARSSEIA
ncbi:hypothetical protein [Rhizobium sp. G21]|nr:hypothetical protein [Rhizobium sp. G21]MBB1250485.1 hypothetical protein [Rhizobium sp. G21]